MSAELDSLSAAMRTNVVPSTWQVRAFASQKLLGDWCADLGARVRFVRLWMRQGAPSCFTLPRLFFPQGFLTAVLQVCRPTQEPLDELPGVHTAVLACGAVWRMGSGFVAGGWLGCRMAHRDLLRILLT